MKDCMDTPTTKHVVAHSIKNVASKPSVLSIEISVGLCIHPLWMRIPGFTSFVSRSLMNKLLSSSKDCHSTGVWL